MCNSGGTVCMRFLPPHDSVDLLWREHATRGQPFTHCLHVCVRAPTSHTRLTHAQGPCPRPHSLHTEIPFMSLYWLLLYPVAWLDHTRQHLAYIHPPRSQAPSLAHPLPFLLPYVLPLPNRHPSHVCLSLAFISTAYWTPPLAWEGDALMVLLHVSPYLPPFTWFHAIKKTHLLGNNRTYSQTSIGQICSRGPGVSEVCRRPLQNPHLSSVLLYVPA